MATRVKRTDNRKRYFEDHPLRHSYTRFVDFVIERGARRVPLVIKRFAYCEHCPIERVTFINVIQWKVTGGYYRGHNNVVIVRKAKEVALKEQVLATTDLPQDEIDRILQAETTTTKRTRERKDGDGTK